MGIGVMIIGQAKRKLQRSLTPRNGSMTSCHSVPKGHVAIYVGETQVKRFVIPISYLNHPLFANLLHLVEEEFGFDHPGNLMIPCSEDYFLNLISCLNRSYVKGILIT